jgi:hypothetical protein
MREGWEESMEWSVSGRELQTVYLDIYYNILVGVERGGKEIGKNTYLDFSFKCQIVSFSLQVHSLFSSLLPSLYSKSSFFPFFLSPPPSLFYS